MDEIIVSVPEDRSPDLDVFRKATEEKMPWKQRSELIKEQFPSTVTLDWFEVFKQDGALLGRIINDILKVDLAQSQPGRPGKRPSLDPKDAADRWRQMTNDDYTMLPFDRAFTILKGDRSVRHMASKVELDRTLVWNLLKGTKRPNPEIMEKVAKAFKKHPSYFVEYRIDYLLGILFHKLQSSPESSVVFYRKLQGKADKRL